MSIKEKLISLVNNTLNKVSANLDIDYTPGVELEFSYSSLNNHRIPNQVKGKLQFLSASAIIAYDENVDVSDTLEALIGHLSSSIQKNALMLHIVENTSDRITWHLGQDYMLYLNITTGKLILTSEIRDIKLNPNEAMTGKCKNMLNQINLPEYTMLLK